ncbi:PREDICTED: uncharacterized protein LOC106810719 isoform X2 [Priapulus caudatus]|uniref:Uncharacterized protein LOC106810719 isoform X2 n=1 Tax=Priapulus caudatus TaxID=37621 RepID=A0ABM1EBS0_PRICU|nr:PREDICTED: uncharacterized protein LOC106810719 isoform X2 [Priapulus caudatus]
MQLSTALLVLVISSIQIRDGTTAFAPTLVDKVIVCRGDATDVTLTFESGFSGEVFADGFHADSRCRASGSGAESLTLQVDHNECGVFQNTAEQTYAVFVTVAQRQNLIGAYDLMFLVTCHYDVVTAVTISANDLEVGQLSTVLVHNTPPPPQIRLTVWEGSDSDDKTTPATFVDIGESLLLVASLEDASIYQNILLYDCRAFSAADQSFQVELVDSAECVNADLVDEVILTEKVQKRVGGDSPVEKWITFRAFKFPDDDVVRFRCQAFACFLASDCDDTCSHVRRRKRATKEEFIQSDVPMVTLSGEIRVRKTNASPISQDDNVGRADDICIPSSGFALGLAFFLIAIVIIVVSAFLIRLRCRRDVSEPLA